MASIKATKGNPFEYDTAYSLEQAGWIVTRINDNTKGIDLIASTIMDVKIHYIECKFHNKFSWNEIFQILEKSLNTVKKQINPFDPKVIFIFKTNQQPVLVAYFANMNNIRLMTFEDYFGKQWVKRPKGFKFWK